MGEHSGPVTWWVRTACTRDCPDSCGILALTDGNDVLRIKGDPALPFTSGFLCLRTQRYLERQEHPERLKQPLMRNGAGKLVPVSVEEAVRHVGHLIRQSVAGLGSASILHVDGGGSLGMLKAAWSALFHRVGPITETHGGICAGAGYEAMRLDYGTRDSPDPDQIPKARQVVLWGKNPYVASPHIVPFIQNAKRAGARVVCIDPLRTRATELADHTFHPAPGSDWALALCILRAAFQRGLVRPDANSKVVGLAQLHQMVMRGDEAAWRARVDLPGSQVDVLVDAILETRPTTYLVGWGLQRHVLGGSSLRLISALAYLLGDVGISGGGLHFAYPRQRGLDLSWTLGHPPARTVPEGGAAQAAVQLTDPPIQLMFIDNANPVAQHPDSLGTREALMRIPHLVVTDCFMTDTAALAEVVLPSSTMLEEDDLMGSFGHPYLALVQRVVPPPGNARSDLEWCQLIAPEVGVDPGLFDARALVDAMLLPLKGDGVDVKRLKRVTVRNPRAPADGVAFADGRTMHPDGCFHAITEIPAEPEWDEYFPLWLMSVSQLDRQCSQLLDEPKGLPPAIVHPEVARKAKLGEGARARLISAQGELTVVVRLDASQRRDVVQCGKGGWLMHGKAVNVLTSNAPTDLGDGIAFYSTRVRLEPCK